MVAGLLLTCSPALFASQKKAVRNLHKTLPLLTPQIQPKGDKDENDGEDIDARAKFWLQRHGGKEGMPSHALISAKKQIDRMKKNHARVPQDAGIWHWTWLGPGNIGGRIRTIVFDHDNPDHMWIGSVSGGIWYSSDAGGRWMAVDDFMANLAVTSIVIDPVNKNYMYAATGEGFNNWDALPGAGIFRSANGGASWDQLPSTDSVKFYFCNRLSHHPTISGTLIAAGLNTVQRSTDWGDTWTKIYDVPGGAVTQVMYQQTDPNRILVASEHGFFLSTDGGSVFKTVTTGASGKMPLNTGRCEGAFSLADGSIYVSANLNHGEIWRSQDGGDTWYNTSSLHPNFFLGSGDQGGYDNAIWVSPFDPNFVIVGGINVWASGSGGTDWEEVSDWAQFGNKNNYNSAHADHHCIVTRPDYTGSDDEWIYDGNDGGIQRVKIMRITSSILIPGWVNLNNGLGITQFYTGSASPGGSWIVGGTQDNSVVRYDIMAGPNTWYTAETGDGGCVAVDYNNNYNIYAEHQFLDFRKSDDAGNTYDDAMDGLGDANNSDNALFIAPFVMDPHDPQTLIAGGRRIWRTTDGADGWGQIRDALFYVDPAICSAIDIAPTDSRIIWVGYSNGLVSYTSDGGGTWTNVSHTTPDLPDRYVTGIAINPTDPNEVFVTLAGYRTDCVWRTTDAGQHWENRLGTAPYQLPAIQVNTVRYHPLDPNWVYLGTDLGVFASENKGQTWSVTPLYSTHDGPVNVEVDELFWQDNDVLIAATHGRGMYECRPLPVVYVDYSIPPGEGNGTAGEPYHTVTEAVNAAGNGSIISIKSATYPEGPLIFRARGKVQATDGTAIIQ